MKIFSCIRDTNPDRERLTDRIMSIVDEVTMKKFFRENPENAGRFIATLSAVMTTK